MSEIIIKRLKENEGRDATIFLSNGFRFFGKIRECDENYLEFFDYKSNAIRIFKISEINEIEIKEVGK